MKRPGITLAELLISLSIVGVIAAMTMPLIGKITPDPNKALYLKAYDALQETVNVLASNKSLFTKTYQVDALRRVDISQFPLLDTTASTSRDYGHYAGTTKLCNLLAETFDASNINCSASNYVFNSANFNNDFNSNVSFITRNGMRWWVVPRPGIVSRTGLFCTFTYQTDVYVDVNSSSSSKNCIYNNDTCKYPDRFKFMISADGRVIPADPVGSFYSTHRTNFNKQKGEIASGNIVNSLDNSVLRIILPIY